MGFICGLEGFGIRQRNHEARCRARRAREKARQSAADAVAPGPLPLPPGLEADRCCTPKEKQDVGTWTRPGTEAPPSSWTTTESTVDESLNEEDLYGRGLDLVGCTLVESNNSDEITPSKLHSRPDTDKVLSLQPLRRGMIMAPPLPLPPSVGLQGGGVDTGNECGVCGKHMGWIFGLEGFGICRLNHEARCIGQACHKSKGSRQKKEEKITSTRTDDTVTSTGSEGNVKAPAKAAFQKAMWQAEIKADSDKLTSTGTDEYGSLGSTEIVGEDLFGRGFDLVGCTLD